MPHRRSLAGRWAVVLLLLSLLLVLLAFSTQHWLAGDYRFAGVKLRRLGLWVHCFRSLADPNDPLQRTFFSGCRWLFDAYTTGYADIRAHLTPPFFVATQLFYTLALMCTGVSGVLLAVLSFCVDEHRDPPLLRLLALLTAISGVCGLIAVGVFGAHGRSYQWTNDSQHNYLSWSYALAVVGMFVQLITSILLWNDARISSKRQRGKSPGQDRPLDQFK